MTELAKNTSDIDQLNIVYYPHKSLQTPANTWYNNDITYKNKLADRLYYLMSLHHGIGLAAPQVSADIPLFVMQCEGSRMDVFYPTILEVSNETVLMPEGCLSDPNLLLNIKRPKSIVVQYENANGVKYKEELHSLTARCFLHEYDHLLGILFIDRVSKPKLNMAIKRRYKLLKSNKK